MNNFLKNRIIKNKNSIISPLPNNSILISENTNSEIILNDRLNKRKNIIINELKIKDSEDVDRFINCIPILNLESTSLDKIAETINSCFVKLKLNNKSMAERLLNYEPKGLGKGELLISFIFDDAEYQGGSVDFDILAGKNKYEVKSYPKIDSSIRLGVDGAITSFNEISILRAFLGAVTEISNFNDKEARVLNSMYSLINSKSNDIISEIQQINIIQNVRKNGITGTYFDKLSRGEFTSKDLEHSQQIINYIVNVISGIQNTSFEYIKCLKTGLIYPIDLSADNFIENKNGTITIIAKYPVKKEDELKVIKSLVNLSSTIEGLKSITNDTSKYIQTLIDNISVSISQKFKKHPMILIKGENKEAASIDNEESSHTSRKTKNKESNDLVCFGVFTNFKMLYITGKSVKIQPVD